METENAKLKLIVADQALDMSAMKELRQNIGEPLAKRKAVGSLRSALGLDDRQSCRIVGLPRSVAQYRPDAREDGPVIVRIRVRASAHRRDGSPPARDAAAEGLVVSHKRTERLHRAEGLREFIPNMPANAAISTTQ